MVASVAEKRNYNDYINYGFTSALADGIEKPQCVLCFIVIGNDYMRPSQLKHDLMTMYPQYAETPVSSSVMNRLWENRDWM